MKGVSENIMLGQMCPLGTGSFDLLLDATMLEDALDAGLFGGGADVGIAPYTPGLTPGMTPAMTPFGGMTPTSLSPPGGTGLMFSPVPTSPMAGFSPYSPASPTPYTPVSPAGRYAP